MMSVKIWIKFKFKGKDETVVSEFSSEVYEIKDVD